MICISSWIWLSTTVPTNMNGSKKPAQTRTGNTATIFYIAGQQKKANCQATGEVISAAPVWEPLPGHTDKYYMHVFHKKQPDLNWENPKRPGRSLQNASTGGWIKRPVAGFRIDAIINIKKAEYFIPAILQTAMTGWQASTTCLMMRKVSVNFWTRCETETLRRNINAFTVGEVFTDQSRGCSGSISSETMATSLPCLILPKPSLGKSPITDGTNANRLHRVRNTKNAASGTQKRLGDIGFISNIIENHDEPRGVSHYIPEGRLSATPARKCWPLSYVHAPRTAFHLSGTGTWYDKCCFPLHR